MYINKAQVKSIMRRCGFLPKEISEYMSAHVAGQPDKPQDVLKIANSAPFAAMLKRRAAYCMKEKAMKHDRLYIMASLNRLYMKTKESGDKVSPWDFLKAEYEPKKMLDSAQFDAMMKVSKAAREQTAKLYGKEAPKPKTLRFKPTIREI
jgi:hypothetical protein